MCKVGVLLIKPIAYFFYVPVAVAVAVRKVPYGEETGTSNPRVELWSYNGGR